MISPTSYRLITSSKQHDPTKMLDITFGIKINDECYQITTSENRASTLLLTTINDKVYRVAVLKNLKLIYNCLSDITDAELMDIIYTYLL